MLLWRVSLINGLISAGKVELAQKGDERTCSAPQVPQSAPAWPSTMSEFLAKTSTDVENPKNNFLMSTFFFQRVWVNWRVT